ncbi:guanylate cyclase, putative [Bodo saltans]|uniref:Guanylate cyclase, putative n=1 Tax=Bodo saltans TaxID=75058 RepID=A0A0S4KGN6_BODSA|nr:guanylate cyclase, putative [Bodo saltans]|eukprot:CUI14142.1 guanylate cyclase, putative [Bodo saltans]
MFSIFFLLYFVPASIDYSLKKEYHFERDFTESFHISYSMIPHAKRYIPPSERPPNAPTKKEIDDLVADHIGGYTKREIKRLAEIHKHFVNFHYEPKNSDGGLIADDGTDPLFYYQSNLPLIQRLMVAQRVGLPQTEEVDESDDENDQDVESLAIGVEQRMQELKDGVSNNAYVAIEKGRLSKLIAIQKNVARNLQDTGAVVEQLQDNKDVFELDPEDRILGRGTTNLQLELLQTLLKFRRDQVNQLKRLMQCMSVKVSDMATALEQASPAPSAQRRGGANRARLAAHAVSAALRTGNSASKPRSENENDSAGDVDLELLTELANEVQYLRREQEYMYFRLYGIQKSPTGVTGPGALGNVDAKGGAASSPVARGLAGAMNAANGPASPVKGGAKGPSPAPTTSSQPARTATSPPPPPRAAGRGNTTAGDVQPIEQHPDYGNFLQRTEKKMRLEMEAIYQSMVEADSAKLFVHSTKGAETLKRLMKDVEDHKAMIETMHHHVVGIFESGRQAIKTCRVLEAHGLEQHDVTRLTRPMERAVATRGVKSHEGDPSPLGKALLSLESRDFAPALFSQAINAVEVFTGELVRVGDPISEDALDRSSYSIGYATEALRHLAVKCCGSILTVVSSLAPQGVSTECAEAILKLLRVLIPQWTEEAMTKLAIDAAEKNDDALTSRLSGALTDIKERNFDLRRLCARQSRGSSRHRSRNTSRGADSGGDVFLAGEPVPEAQSEEDLEEDDSPRLMSRGSTRSKQTPTPTFLPPPAAIVLCHQEVQCEIVRWQPPSARSDGSDDRTLQLSQRSGAGSPNASKRRSSTPQYARHHEVGEDAFTQTTVVARKGEASQTDESSFIGGGAGASPNANTALASRVGSAKPQNPSPLSSSLMSRPVSALRFTNPLVENDKGEKLPMIPKQGALVVISIAGIHRLWHECPSVMPSLMEAYITLLRDEMKSKRGIEIRMEDDALLAVFPLEVDALQWAVAVQHHCMYLPYPPELLSLAEASAVPHPSMLGGAVPTPSPLAFEEGRVASNTLDTAYLQQWTWRGFRLRIGLHSGSTCVPRDESGPQAPGPDEIDVGGSHVAFAAKMGLWAPAGSIVASSSFTQAVEAQLGANAHLQSLASTLSFIKWEEVPAPLDDRDIGDNKTSDALEAIVCVVPDVLKHRGAVALTALGEDVDDQNHDGKASEPHPPLGSMVQRWACGFMDQVNSVHRGRLAKLAFVLVEIETSKHFPHYNATMIANASKQLIDQIVSVAEKRGGACFAVTNATVVVTFESPIVAAQYALYLQLEALQFSAYPHELLLIPACKELYEDSGLTWRGLKVRSVGHFGPAGVVLRHLANRQLEYFGESMICANELSQSAPFGCFSCSNAFFNEVAVCLDVLEDPVVLECSTAELTFVLPRFLFRREAAIRAYLEFPERTKATPSFPGHTFQLGGYEEKKTQPEYATGIKTNGDVHAMRKGADTYGILAVTQHSLLDLWKEEESLREAFELRLVAAIEEADASGGGRVGKRLPTRRDCRNDILALASMATSTVESIVTHQYGGFVAAESKAAFLTNVFVFPNMGSASLCAMHLQEVVSKQLQSHVPDSLKERLDRVFSAETGQIVMEGVRVGCALHSGAVHLVHSAGCRQWAYYGPALHQAAAVASTFACSGETLITSMGLKSLKQCGPSELDGADSESYLSTEVVVQPLLAQMLPPGDDAPRLVGELAETNLTSILPSSHSERLIYFLRRSNGSEESADGANAAKRQPSAADSDEHRAKRKARQRQMQSKYGFLSLHQLRDISSSAARFPTLATDAKLDEPSSDKPAYLWSASLAQKLYRTAWRVVTKASRVMGYPLDFDIDPVSFDAPLREATNQTSKLVAALVAGDDRVDFSDVLDMRSVLDDASAAVLQRCDESLQQVLIALGTRLDKPLAMHRTMQSAIIIPPSEKDDSALYKGTDVGPGKRVTPLASASSRPASRERSMTPNTPTSMTPLGGPTGVSVGTENPRFVSAGRRPNSRQRGSTPVLRLEQGTQPSPADVPAIVAMALPSALMVQEHHHWATPASLFRPGIGVDIATMRIKERRIIELEREVERLHDESRALIVSSANTALDPARLFGGTTSFAALARAASAGAEGGRLTPTTAEAERSAMLLGKMVDWQQSRRGNSSKPLSLPPLEATSVLHSTSHSRPPSTLDPNVSGVGLIDDDGVDFSVQGPLPGAAKGLSVGKTLQHEGDRALVEVEGEGQNQSSYLSSVAANYSNAQPQHGTMSFTRHIPPSSRQHWRHTSPLAPLQSSYTTTFQRDGGFLLSGEMTSKMDLVAPFSSVAGAMRKPTSKPKTATIPSQGKRSSASHATHIPPHSAATPDPYTQHEYETAPQVQRPQSGD